MKAPRHTERIKQAETEAAGEKKKINERMKENYKWNVSKAVSPIN